MRSSWSVLIGVFATVVLATSLANGQMPSNVSYRVLMIKTTKGQGTGFTIDVDGREYLITAKHMVSGLEPESTVNIRQFDRRHEVHWVPLQMKVFTCDDPIDIAVLIPPAQLTVDFTLEPSMNAVLYGQDAFFVGFPAGLYSDVDSNVELAYPLPFVKKGLLSALEEKKVANKEVKQILLDGLNLGGFSGSPIVFRPNTADLVYNVMGVVSGYMPDYSPVLTPREIRPQDVSPADEATRKTFEEDGKVYRLEEAPHQKDQKKVMLNTGVVIGFSIEHAVDLIHQHPNGPKVDPSYRPTVIAN